MRRFRRGSWAAEMSADGRLLFFTCGVRSFAYGFLSVILGLYLAAIGLDPATVGAVFTAALAGGAVMTIALTAVADRVGRRNVLMVGALLMAAAGAAFATTNIPLLLAVAAIVGTISPSGKEVGPFLSIEQAILPQTTGDERRTGVFAAYNLVASLAGAVGALGAGLPGLLGVGELDGYRLQLWGYAAASLVMLLLFSRLSSKAEAQPAPSRGPRRALGLHRSRGVVVKLAGLFAVDAFAGGFIVQGLLAYWFHLRFGADTNALAAIFFGANLLSALSFLAAVPIARRIGLLNTMVFTHLPSNVLLVLVPLMPDLNLAVALLLARFLLSQLDVPTRQSYTMALVDPDERSAAAGITSVARNAAASIGPTFAGATLTVPALGLPFIVAGTLKILYDVTIYFVFRGVKPPEEQSR
ncbi:MAG TPA: MFS transporter [Chloroflexota bacterium]